MDDSPTINFDYPLFDDDLLSENLISTNLLSSKDSPSEESSASLETLVGDRTNVKKYLKNRDPMMSESAASTSDENEDDDEDITVQDKKNKRQKFTNEKITRNRKINRKNVSFLEDKTLVPDETYRNAFSGDPAEEMVSKVVIKKVFNEVRLPEKATRYAACYDLFCPYPKVIAPGARTKVSFGFKMKLPKGYCAKLYSRSGLASVYGVQVCGGTTIIDPDFYGPLSTYMVNLNDTPYTIGKNHRPVQMKIEKIEDIALVEGDVDEFSNNGERSDAGYGSTGL